jgi:tetratricopeptide (TPR) repeat protein
MTGSSRGWYLTVVGRNSISWDIFRVKFHLILFLALLQSTVVAQTRSTRNRPARLHVNLQDHLDLNFRWTLSGKSQAYMNEGINQYLENNIPKAILNFDEVIKTDPVYLPAFYYRGLCYKNGFSLREAKDDLATAMKLNSNIPEVYIELGEIYHYEKRLKDARKLFEQAARLNPKLEQAYFCLGNLALDQKDLHAAMIAYQKSVELNPKFADGWRMIGFLNYNRNASLEDNLVNLNKALEVDSSNSQALFAKISVLWQYKAYDKAIIDLNRLVQMNPGNMSFLLLRANLQIELGDYDAAFVDFRKSLLAKPASEGKYGSEDGRLESLIDAQNAARYLIQVGYGFEEKYFSLIKKAFCRMIVGNKAGTMISVNEAIRMKPTAAAFLIKALEFEKEMKGDSAEVYFGRALQFDNGIFEAHRKLVIYLAEVKKYEAALEHVHEMQKLQPESDNAFRLSGLVKGNMQDYTGCIKDLDQFLALHSADVQTWNAKAFCLSKNGDYKGAVAAYRRCIDLDDEDIPYYLSIHEVNMLAKDTVNAIANLREVKALVSDGLYIRFELAKLLVQTHQFDSADVELKFLLDEANLAIYYVRARQIVIEPGTTLTIDRSNALFWIGKAWLMQSKVSKGMARIEESVKLDPKNDEKRFYLVTNLVKLGKPKEARKHLEILHARNYLPAVALYNQYH